MPGIKVFSYEDDGGSGWFIHFVDPENLDGQPVEMYFHLEDKVCQDLASERRAVSAPVGKFEEVRTRLPNKFNPPKGKQTVNSFDELPSEIQSWVRAYDEHLQDLIDRVKWGVTRDMPHSVLEDVRSGKKAPPKSEKLQGFIARQEAQSREQTHEPRQRDSS